MKSVIAVLAVALIWCACPPAFAGVQSTTLSVEGMTCAACPITVKKALTRVDGVTDVSVNFEKKQAKVTFDDAKTSVKVLTQATADAGYPSSPVEEGAK